MASTAATALTGGVTPPAGTREQILSTARELFVSQGFAATTTRELAERLGFTKAALYYHFRTKDDLLKALAAPFVEQMRALVTGTPLSAAPSARRALLAAYVDIAGADLDLIRVLTQDPSVTHRPATAEHADLSRRILQLLSGQAEPDTAARARARAAVGAIWAGLVHADPDDDPTAVRAATLAAACGALGIPAPSTRHPLGHRTAAR
ncbi:MULTISPECIES: TetR/AcrR family transcriptional regulator [unclassified Pseudofrankia]|uniref:TetR/AcrR family transcriptional regulator n=1 Tax=unclassified Pseudofrankia TaxID=2994372 RepID=UPI0008DAEF61|nr:MULTISPECIES: TetR/AcrR family transcriptional regulator [unclassified Pseudofrankia]MDT3438114.1 helix-turn-helix domain-containing protein [Pseudofrankia sp. BMG5.37]OHV56822.1 hypothetical protein BCD48_07130 [Pseudofrankia sp. BMG5.36]